MLQFSPCTEIGQTKDSALSFEPSEVWILYIQVNIHSFIKLKVAESAMQLTFGKLLFYCLAFSVRMMQGVVFHSLPRKESKHIKLQLSKTQIMRKTQSAKCIRICHQRFKQADKVLKHKLLKIEVNNALKCFKCPLSILFQITMLT